MDALIRWLLAEDIGRRDVTTELVVDAQARGIAVIEARESTVVAGLEAARRCFATLEPEVEWTPAVRDGDRAGVGEVLATIVGTLAPILTAERTALNLIARLSGIATETSRYVDAVAGTAVRILDTRKTTPGLRILEKDAVRAGGAHNHRFGLDDGVLIKDNHISAAGGIAEAVQRAKRNVRHGLRIQVEVSRLDQLQQVLSEGADAVLLDNMSVDDTKEAVLCVGGKILIESSGGITLENVRQYALTGVDFISVGAITHSARWADVALEVTP